jgi:SIR2-like domain
VAELSDQYKFVVESLMVGRVIPFLGSGVNLRTPPRPGEWKPDDGILPSGAELAEHLAAIAEYPRRDDEKSLNLLRIAQYVAIRRDETYLYDNLHPVFDRDFEPTAVHRLLAGLPAALAARGGKKPHQLIVTTNYDDVLERAFDEAGQAYDLVYYEAKRGDRQGKFWHRPPDDEPRVIEKPTTYRKLSLDSRSVILKIHGAVSRNRDRGDDDSYVITEDDYIDYPSYDDIPKVLSQEFGQRRFLFLGYSLGDWNLRVIFRRIWKDQGLQKRSWSVSLSDDPIERLFWAKRNVEFLRADLQEYAGGLETMLRDWPGAGGEP